MSTLIAFLVANAARIAAILAIVVSYQFSRPPQLSQAERSELAAGFGFSRIELPELTDYEYRPIRAVHPELEHIAGWLSALGASVGLNDLDGDGLPNDVCLIDTRIDQVIITPVPSTPERYETFTLDHSTLTYEPTTMAPIGCLPNDMNEDGHMDLLIYYWGRTPTAFLYDPATSAQLMSDSYIAQEIVPEGALWNSSAATFADLDGDGHQDLIIGNYYQDGRSILDRNNDQIIEMQHSMSRAYNGGGTHIFLWKHATTGPTPSVQFSEVEWTDDRDMIYAWTLAVGAADLDGDLLPEIYFANDFGPDRLLHNRSTPGKLHFTLLEGERTFTTPRSKVLGRDSFKGMGIDFADINNDGMFDMYVSNIAADWALHESHFMFVSTGERELIDQGIAPYTDESESLGVSRSSWGWESRLADFNNDGVLEAIQATGFKKGEINHWPEMQELGLGSDELLRYPQMWPRFELNTSLNGYAHNPFYVRNGESGRFFDLAADLGIDQVQVSRGIATADIDGDGDLDFAVANQWDTSIFYQNECPNCESFLGVHLLLPVGNELVDGHRMRTGHPGPDMHGRPAIGATATVHLPSGQRRISMVDGGNGQGGARSSDLHFGLGNVEDSARLNVDFHWRDSHGQVHQETIQLTPGWHTILLGNQN